MKTYARQAAALASLCIAALQCAGADGGDVQRGLYLSQAGGCMACHTEDKKDAVPYAGGRELKTPFGKFYGPNITPDPEAGIGKWTEADFVRAMRHGERPDGANYFPAFPYPSFTRISDADLRDLWAYLRSLPPAKRASQPHELRFPPGSGANAPAAPPTARGEYLVQALGHCGECHTPRSFLGGPRRDRALAGGRGVK